jgi:ribose transport system ATP-binding protein
VTGSQNSAKSQLLSEPTLRLEGVSKHFGGVRALRELTLEIAPGEVHAVVGQNGSGKSTLVKILAGYHVPDSGRAWVRGEEVSLHGRPPEGVAIVHQDLGLVPTLSVTENFGARMSFGARRLRPINWRDERRRCRALLDEFEIDLDPEQLVDSASPGERAMLAIVRAIRQVRAAADNYLLILDEPTTYLAAAEVGRVTALMQAVARSGGSVIFISHRLGEILGVSDRISVLRDGRLVGTLPASDTSPAGLISLMLGRDIGDFYPDKAGGSAVEGTMSLRDVSGQVIDGVSLTVRAGEILGITGLAGMGQDELPYIMNGAAPHTSGTLNLDGEEIKQLDPRTALERGVVLVPANRPRDGGWLEATAAENVSLPFLNGFYRRGWLRLQEEVRTAGELMARFGVRPPDPRRPLGTFSGGNQQKVVLAKWLQRDPRILLLHEPTQGVDAGAKKDILELVKGTAERGAAVVIFSAEYEQVAQMCHRVLVLRDGRVSAELTGSNVSEERVVEACHAYAA